VMASIAVDGAPLTVTTIGRYQNARVIFSGTAGQRLSVGMTGVTMGSSTCCGVKVSVLSPGGATFVYPAYVGSRGGDIDTTPRPATGTYTIVVDPQDDATGAITLTLSTEVAGAVVPGGGAKLVTIARAGQNARLSFDGVGGQTVSLTLSGGTFGPSPCCDVSVTVLKPDGTTLLTRLTGTTTAVVALQLPATGTYQVLIDPNEARTGSISVSISGPGADVEPAPLALLTGADDRQRAASRR